MNNVSWFLYIADIIINLQVLFVLGAIFLAIVLIITIIVGAHKRDFGNWTEGRTMQGFALKLSPLVLLLWFFAAIIPSKATLYMIAASQVGEQIIQLEEVQDIGGEAGGLAKDAIELLRQQIQEQLTEKPVEAD